MAASVPDKREPFSCEECGFSARYDYHGRRPPFMIGIVFFEDTFVLKTIEPSAKTAIVAIGSKCSECARHVCVAPACGIFYTRRFCAVCARSNIDEFPERMQLEIRRHMGAT